MLELVAIRHRYGDVAVLDDVSLTLDAGRIGCLLGPSGCGKTTILRCIAGFEPLAAGRVRVAGQTLSGDGRHLAPAERRIGMVFQDYALMPHLSVRDNVAFGLRRWPRDERDRRVAQLLEMVGLGAKSARLPHELSGGQQQRVAVARALAPRPRLLLMDEPFSSLDAQLRERLAVELRDVLKAAGTTVLMVTHDHREALSLADDVGVMRDGRLLQWSSAYDVYHRPADPFVAGFVGDGAWLDGEIGPNGDVDVELGRVSGRACHGLAQGTPVRLLLRPDDVIHDDSSSLQAKVVGRRFRGADFLYELELASGTRILSAVPSHHDHPVGEPLGLRLQAEHLVVFPRAPATSAS